MVNYFILVQGGSYYCQLQGGVKVEMESDKIIIGHFVLSYHVPIL